jgi:branched-chain amino acid transport system substrate-binding protein
MAALTMGVTACGSGGGGKAAKQSKSATAKLQPGATLTVYASVPLQGASGGQGKAIEDGAQLAVDSLGGKVGKFKIEYKRLDDSLASTGAADEGKGKQNARDAVADKNSIGYIGEYNSGISKVTIPILNKAGIPQVSPANTYVGLTTDEAGSEPGEPDIYYPTKKRNYARVVPKDTVQSAALATAAKDAGCKSIRIWNSKTTYSVGLAKNLETAAADAGLKVEGNDGIDPKATNYDSLAAQIKADCFVFTGEIESNGVQATKAAADVPSVKQLFAGDGMCLNDTADPKKGIPAAIAGKFHCTIATLDPKTFGPEGKKFFKDYAAKFKVAKPDPYAIYGYESMALLLDSLKRASADGTKAITRADVVDALLSTKDRDSVLGTYSIDENGDTSLTDYGLYKIQSGKLEFDRVIKAAAG